MSTKVIPIEKTPLLRSDRKVSSFWEVIVLLAYASLAASRTLLQQLLVCPNFPLYSEDFILLVKNNKSDSHELSQQHKQLKTMEMSEAWPDTFDDIHKFQSEPAHKIYDQQ